MSDGYREYRVYEYGHDTKEWYAHGSVHTNIDRAYEDLQHKTNFYGRYGRKFRLKSRHLSNWEFE